MFTDKKITGYINIYISKIIILSHEIYHSVRKDVTNI